MFATNNFYMKIYVHGILSQ